MTHVISIDSGSSYMKHFDGRVVATFPAVVEEIAAGLPDYKDEMTVDGARYVVGDAALNAKMRHQGEPHRGRGYHGSHVQYVQMCWALEQMGAPEQVRTLVCSLPYGDHQDDAVRKRITQRREYTWEARGVRRQTSCDRVVTCAQGAGALLYYQATRSASERAHRAILIDIGSCTTDVVVVVLDARTDDYVYNHGASRSFRGISVTGFYADWLQRTRDLDGLQGREFSYHEFMGMAQRGDFQILHDGDLVDVSRGYHEARRNFTAQLMSTVRDNTGDLWPAFDTVILTGGGANLVDSSWQDRRTVRLPASANAVGQYLAAGGQCDVARVQGVQHAA